MPLIIYNLQYDFNDGTWVSKMVFTSQKHLVIWFLVTYHPQVFMTSCYTRAKSESVKHHKASIISYK